MGAFIKKLHGQGQHYVLIVDPAIHNRSGYPTFDDGIAQDVFVKQASGDVFIGSVWPGTTAFPSFYAENTQAWWTKNIATFREGVPIDGSVECGMIASGAEVVFNSVLTDAFLVLLLFAVSGST